MVEEDFQMKRKVVFLRTPSDDPRPTRTVSSSLTVIRLPSDSAIGISSTL